MSKFAEAKEYLLNHHHRWLVTGCAGFIGSNLVEFLLKHNQQVVGVDNFSTGKQANLDDIKECVGDKWKLFNFIEGDVADQDVCSQAVKDCDYVLHQAALGSVPRSINDPLRSNNSNVSGFLNMIWEAKEANIKKFIYASSSSVYGDDPNLPKQESVVGNPLSPYAVTKKVNELYANVFFRNYQMPITGIRYFNVFGRRQDPNGAYAAVIPKWVKSMLNGDEVAIFGDGQTSRDFCYIENVIQMNVLAALSENESSWGEVYNCAYSDRTTLTELFYSIRNGLGSKKPELQNLEPLYKDFRPGDIRHSHADITKAQKEFGYEPLFDIHKGLRETLDWYVANL